MPKSHEIWCLFVLKKESKQYCDITKLNRWLYSLFWSIELCDITHHSIVQHLFGDKHQNHTRLRLPYGQTVSDDILLDKRSIELLLQRSWLRAGWGQGLSQGAQLIPGSVINRACIGQGEHDWHSHHSLLQYTLNSDASVPYSATVLKWRLTYKKELRRSISANPDFLQGYKIYSIYASV